MSIKKMKCVKCGATTSQSIQGYDNYDSEEKTRCSNCREITRHKMIELEIFDEDRENVNPNALWDVPLKLNRIEDEMLDVALKLADRKDLLTYEMIENDYVLIKMHYEDCCNRKVYDELVSKLLNDEVIEAGEEVTYYTCEIDKDFILCYNADCRFSKCLFKVAGYIQYLKDHGQLEDVLTERKAYRQNLTNLNTYYNFEWNPGIHLREIPENEYQLAKLLLQTQSVNLRQNIYDGEMYFESYSLCRNKLLDCTVSIQNIVKNKQSDAKPENMRLIPSKSGYKLGYSDCEKCECRTCPILVALYLQYLSNTGQSELIETERAIATESFSLDPKIPFEFSYTLDENVINHLLTISEHDFELALFLQEHNLVSLNKEKVSDIYGIQLANETLSENKNISKEMLSPYFEYKIKKVKLKNLKISYIICYAAIIDYLKKTGTFYKFLRQKRERDADIIASLEWHEKKNPQISHVLQAAESQNVHFLRCIIQGEPKVGKSELAKKIAYLLAKNNKIESNTIIKYTLQQLSEIHTKHTTEGYVYHPLKTKQLYVFTGIREFLVDYKAYAPTSLPAYELRKKSFEHVLLILSSIPEDTYVILEGSEKEIDELLTLNEKISFLFSENRIVFENLSPTNIFMVFYNNLIDELAGQFFEHPEFQQEFVDYITYNDRYLPFKNKELGIYLAKYCNEHHALKMPPDYYNKKSISECFENIVGMENIKVKLSEFENYAKFLKKAKTSHPTMSANLHMMFCGNSGTGKTTIARLVADILFTYGLIQENKLIEVERKDLVASHIGQTAIKTSEVIEKAKGGVLFIDEAYSLNANSERDFGHEAIATLIKAMDDNKDELVVIFAGYHDKMNEFMNMNDGISSRIGYTFEFKDYTPEELVQIYQLKMRKNGFIVNQQVSDKVFEICTCFSKKRHFGNGRFVDKLIQETILHYANDKNCNENLLTIQHVPDLKELLSQTSSDSISLDEQLDQMIGMKQIKEEIRQFEKYIAFYKKAKENKILLPSSNLHMLFCGNPGTGKTTVARMIANILYDLGFLYENKVVEVERKDLVAGYVGQTAIKTSEIIEKAMGGVLFIDEAYSLNGGYANDFGKEVIATLIKAMEDYKDHLVVIFAGYKDEMKHFVELNPGIASRIGYTFNFDDYSPEELSEIYCHKLLKTNLEIEETAISSVNRVMQYFCHVTNFGNGRFVDRLLQMTLMKHAKNSDDFIIKTADIPTIREVIDTMAFGDEMLDPDKISDQLLERVAYHEIGHALVQKLLFPDRKISRITIDPEGNGALGYVEHETIDLLQPTKEDFFHDICVCMAGLACEEVMLNHYASGGSSDLRKATYQAKYMIMKLGMSKNGFAVIEEESKDVLKEVNELLQKAFETAKEYCIKHQESILQMKAELMRNKVMDDAKCTQFLNKKG